MHRVSRFFAILAASALALALTPAGAAASSRPAAAVVVKLAVAGPLTQGATAWGRGMLRGAELARQDYASALAAAGVDLTIVSADDLGDPAAAVNVARLLVADARVLGVVGHVNSGCSIPAAKIYAGGGLAMVSPASTNPALTQLGLVNVFRTCGTDAGQGSFVAGTVRNNLRLMTAYVVDDSTPYGTGQSAGFAARFRALGGKIVALQHTSDRTTDFSALVSRIKSAKPAVVYYGGIYNAGAALAKQLKTSAVTSLFAGPDGIADPGFVYLAGRTAAEGALASNVGLPFDQMVGGVAFRTRDAARATGTPLPTDAYAYDATVAIIKGILAVAAQPTGPTTLRGTGARVAVRARIAASRFAGLTGPIAFSSTGDTLYPAFSAWRVKSGVWRECAQVGKPVAPLSVLANHSFAVTGSLKPRFAAGSRPVSLRFWRKVGTVWVLANSVYGRASNAGAFSEYAAAATLSTKGTWRVIATQNDALRGSMDSRETIFTVR